MHPMQTMNRDPPGEPGELRSCPNIAEVFSNNCFGAERLPVLVNIAQVWSMLSEVWPAFSHFDQHRSDSAESATSLVNWAANA